MNYWTEGSKHKSIIRYKITKQFILFITCMPFTNTCKNNVINVIILSIMIEWKIADTLVK